MSSGRFRHAAPSGVQQPDISIPKLLIAVMVISALMLVFGLIVAIVIQLDLIGFDLLLTDWLLFMASFGVLPILLVWTIGYNISASRWLGMLFFVLVPLALFRLPVLEFSTYPLAVISAVWYGLGLWIYVLSRSVKRYYISLN